jgi:hypothetical protein
VLLDHQPADQGKAAGVPRIPKTLYCGWVPGICADMATVIRQGPTNVLPKTYRWGTLSKANALTRASPTWW